LRGGSTKEKRGSAIKVFGGGKREVGVLNEGSIQDRRKDILTLKFVGDIVRPNVGKPMTQRGNSLEEKFQRWENEKATDLQLPGQKDY